MGAVVFISKFLFAATAPHLGVVKTVFAVYQTCPARIAECRKYSAAFVAPPIRPVAHVVGNDGAGRWCHVERLTFGR